MNQNELGNKLKSLRVQSNYTQKEIAEKLIITPQTISKWELGVSSPSIEMLIQLADLYNVSVDEMIREEGNTVLHNKKEKRNNTKFEITIVLYLLYFLLTGLGITLFFVDYININGNVLDLGNLFDQYLDTDIILHIPMKLSDLFIQVLLIMLPITLLVVGLIDKKKIVSSYISLLGFGINYIAIMMYSSSLFYISANVGIVLHGVYALLLLLITVLLLTTSSIDMKRYIEENSKPLGFALAMFLTVILVPLGFYPEILIPQVLYFIALLMAYPIIVFMNEEIQPKTLVITVSVIVMLISAYYIGVDFFNGLGMLFSITSLLYTTLVIVFLLSKVSKQVLLKMSSGVSVKIISIIAYTYLMFFAGDLYFNNGSGVSVYFINELFIAYATLISGLLVIGLLVAQLYQNKKVELYICVVFLFVQLPLLTYCILNYELPSQIVTTDGQWIYFPPFILGIYYIIHLTKMRRKSNDFVPQIQETE